MIILEKERLLKDLLWKMNEITNQTGTKTETVVVEADDRIVYIIEGNSGDSCRVNQYPVDYYEIRGYGTPDY